MLAVPADEKDWSPRLKVYFKAVQKYHARPKETELGELMVTNLSSFPSALTVISVPDGDIKAHRESFIVNEDLKRMGCSGRSGMTLVDPTPATQAKFYSTYKISEKVPLPEAVIDLVKLCQVALFIFAMLEPEYIDGLLCDVTETAIGNWWTKIGSEHYNMEPTDGMVGPTTVAALLGMLMGARNRLSSYGASVTKDVFDIDTTKRAIGHFQKSQKLEKTRRLDRQTLLQLHKVTAKAAAGEEWGVQKAVNTAVSQFGKRGEILSGVIGSREKAGIGDIETVDIDKFKELVQGERAKWLWHGKQRRPATEHHDRSIPDMTNILFGKEEEKEREREKEKEKLREREKEKESASSARKTHSLPIEDVEPILKTRDTPNTIYSVPTPESTLSVTETPSDGALHKHVLRSVADRVSDARSGLGRIRDAVGGGLRGHSSRPSKDESGELAYSSSIGSLVQSVGVLSSPGASGRAFTWQNKPQEYLNAFQKKHPDLSPQVVNEPTQASRVPSGPPLSPLQESQRNSVFMEEGAEVRKELAGVISAAPSTFDESDLQGPFLQAERLGDISFSVLQRRHSLAIPENPLARPLDENRWPRSMSFSAASEAILRWDEIINLDGPFSSPEEQMVVAELAQSLHVRILTLQNGLCPWFSHKVDAIESLEKTYTSQQETLQQAYYNFSDEYQRLKQNSAEMIAEERGRVTEAIKDVEVQMAKLEYEISALVSKVQDVEDGVTGFEATVINVEKRAEELKVQLETESWVHWMVRTLTGIGTGPNITRQG